MTPGYCPKARALLNLTAPLGIMSFDIRAAGRDIQCRRVSRQSGRVRATQVKAHYQELGRQWRELAKQAERMAR